MRRHFPKDQLTASYQEKRCAGVVAGLVERFGGDAEDRLAGGYYGGRLAFREQREYRCLSARGFCRADADGKTFNTLCDLLRLHAQATEFMRRKHSRFRSSLALVELGRPVSTSCRVAANDFVSSPSTRTRVVEKFRAFLAMASIWGASEPSHDLKVAECRRATSAAIDLPEYGPLFLGGPASTMRLPFADRVRLCKRFFEYEPR